MSTVTSVPDSMSEVTALVGTGIGDGDVSTGVGFMMRELVAD